MEAAAGGHPGDLPAMVSAVGEGLETARTPTWEEEAPTDVDRPPTPLATDATSAGEHLGDSPAEGAAEPPPPGPPEAPRMLEQEEEVGVKELQEERAKLEDTARDVINAHSEIE